MPTWSLILLLMVLISIAIIMTIIAIRAYIRNAKNGEYKREIIKTQIIGNDSTKSASSSIVRGAVGGALFGGVGALGGAMSGKNNSSTTFLLIYKDGTKKAATVKNNTRIYKTYIKLLEV